MDSWSLRGTSGLFGHVNPLAEVEHGLGSRQDERQDEHGAQHGGGPPQPVRDPATDTGDDLVVPGALKSSHAPDGRPTGSRTSVEQRGLGRAGVASENDTSREQYGRTCAVGESRPAPPRKSTRSGPQEVRAQPVVGR